MMSREVFMSSTYALLDSRKRVSLAAFATTNQYLVTAEPSGRIILDPAVVMTEVERDYLANGELRERVAAAKNVDPETLNERPKRQR
jgi:hypothetical protein